MLLDIEEFLKEGIWLSDSLTCGRRKFWLGWGGLVEQSHMQLDVPLQFFLTDFFLDRPKILVPRYFVCLNQGDLADQWHRFGRAKEWTTITSKSRWDSPNVEDFKISFSSIMKLIERKEISKAVPVVFAESKNFVDSPEQRWALFSRCLTQNSPYHSYGTWGYQRGLVGLTPEMLFCKIDDGYQSMALAGTAGADRSIKNFCDDPKEKREHDLVVEDLVARLAKLGLVSTEIRQPLCLEQLIHFKTTVKVTCDMKPFIDLVDILHPTGALGVLPSTKDWRILKEIGGQQSRSFFGAPFGAVTNRGEQLCVVAIRNLEWIQSIARVGSGCGIISESRFESEWNELALKRKLVFDLLGL